VWTAYGTPLAAATSQTPTIVFTALHNNIHPSPSSYAKTKQRERFHFAVRRLLLAGFYSKSESICQIYCVGLYIRYVTVLIGRIFGLAWSSILPSVCLILSHTDFYV